MKSTYRHWIFAMGVILPTATAWTSSTIINRPRTSCSLLQRMSSSGESNENESIDYGRDFPRHHKFSRIVDPNTNNLDVDIDAVNSLINERVMARENKDFRRADNILNQLLTRHAVIINDSNNTWKTGTKREVKKRKKVALASPPKAAVAVSSAGVGNENGDGPNINISRSNQYYQLSPDAGPNSSTLSEKEIVALIDDRRTAQRDRDYKEADSIRHQLKVAGVYLEDGLREWRWDGKPYDTIRGKLRGYDASSTTTATTSSQRPRFSLVQSEYSLAFDNNNDDDDDVNMATVNDLLAQRSKFKSSGNYEKSDAIRDRLFETYNIRIDDRLGEWSVGGNFGNDSDSHWASSNDKQTLVYTKSDTSSDHLSAAEEKYVQAKVDERMRAKRTRNYDLSDSIRDELWSRFDVTIHDKINEWSAGGDFGEDNSWNNVLSVKESDGREITGDGEDEFDDGFDNSDSYDAGGNQEYSQGQGDEDINVSPRGKIFTSLSRDQLECLTVVQLKDKLRGSGLTVSGTKAKLINRLLGA